MVQSEWRASGVFARSSRPTSSVELWQNHIAWPTATGPGKASKCTYGCWNMCQRDSNHNIECMSARTRNRTNVCSSYGSRKSLACMSPQTMPMSAVGLRLRLLWVFYQWEDGVAEKPDDGILQATSKIRNLGARGTVTPTTSEKSQRSCVQSTYPIAYCLCETSGEEDHTSADRPRLATAHSFAPVLHRSRTQGDLGTLGPWNLTTSRSLAGTAA